MKGYPSGTQYQEKCKCPCVRESAALACKALVARAGQPAAKRVEQPKDVHTRAAEDRLRFSLGTRARIVRKGRGGKIEIDFTNENELQRLFEYLTER